MGRAHGGPCFKPSGAHPMAAGHQEVDTTAWPPALTPRGWQAPNDGSLRGRRTLTCDQSSKVEVLPPSGRGSRPSCLVASASLRFPRTLARITTFRCVERSRDVRLRERKKQEEKKEREFTGVGTVGYGGPENSHTLFLSSHPQSP